MFLRYRQRKNPKISKFMCAENKILGIADYLAENIQIPCAKIPEIKPLTFCVFKGSKTKKS